MITENYLRSYLVIFLLPFFLTLTLAFSCAPKAKRESKANKEIELKIIDKGYYAGISGREMSFYVIKDEKNFSSLLNKIHSAEIPTPKTAVVDFSKIIVIAVIHGERPTGGYSISINEKAFLSDGILKLTIISKKPPAGQLLTQAFSNPYIILSATTEKSQIREVYFTGASGKLLKIVTLQNLK